MKNLKSVVLAFAQFLNAVFTSRTLILELARRDFKSRYLGSVLGLAWAVAQPLFSLVVMWTVFTFGFKSGMAPNGDGTFALWLIVGMIPWFFLADGLSQTASCLLEYRFLIKNVAFRPSIIPVFKLMSLLGIHLFFVVVIIVVVLMQGLRPTLYWLQWPYFLICALSLLVGSSWLFSSLTVIIRDTAQIVGVMVQLLFWSTPIFWTVNHVPGRIAKFIKLNPVYYITEGYRQTFITGEWFWKDLSWTLSFWVVTLALFITGALVFRMLKDKFADVI